MRHECQNIHRVTGQPFGFSIHEEAGVSYEDFLKVFQSPESQITIQYFQHCQRWGIREFPSILLEDNDRIIHLASGYTTSAELIQKLNAALNNFKMVF